MCGIVGMAGALERKHQEAFEDLVRVCQVRGRDSTGVFKVGSNDAISWAKRLGPPDYLLDTKSYEKTISHGPLPKVLVGHCRAKTVGANNEDNAHPFVFENVIGVHNGTLRGYYNLEDARDFDVDSQVLYWNINKNGIDDTIKTLDPAGAWALVFWDRRAKTLNFLRNSERPLYFTHSKDCKVMMWASETWMFAAASRRIGIDLWEGGDEKKTFYPLPENNLWTFEVDFFGKTPPDVFRVSTRELKGEEVRGHSGNFQKSISHGWSGDSGFAKGGEVSNPFRQPAVDDPPGLIANLDDPLPKLGDTQRPLRNQLLTLLPGGSQTTSTSPHSSLVNTQENTGKTQQRNSKTLSNDKTSLPSRSSNSSPPATNVVFLSGSKNNYTYPKKSGKVSIRSLRGMAFITDLKTGKEYGERSFEGFTDGICCYCEQPIGDLEEVNEIFASRDGFGLECVRFQCKSCVNPVVV